MMKNKFIEVTGEGTYQEQIETYILTMTLEVRAVDESTAMDELATLKEASIKTLTESGLSASEIIDGGHDLSQHWTNRKKTGKYARYKIIVESAEESTLNTAAQNVSTLFQHQRYQLDLEMKQPRFKNDQADQQIAIKAAYETALSKAKAIASISDVQLGKLIEATELASGLNA